MTFPFKCCTLKCSVNSPPLPSLPIVSYHYQYNYNDDFVRLCKYPFILLELVQVVEHYSYYSGRYFESYSRTPRIHAYTTI